jgi:hypothetical protein
MTPAQWFKTQISATGSPRLYGLELFSLSAMLALGQTAASSVPSIDQALGVGDYADVISGVDDLIAKGYVDKDRVGCGT